MRGLGVILVIIVASILLAPDNLSLAQTVAVNKLAPPEVSATINEQALLEMLALDSQYNLLGIGSKERKSYDVRLTGLRKKLAAKYGVKLNDLSLSGADSLRAGGGISEGRARGFVALGEEWTRVAIVNPIVQLRLPDVQFRSGTIFLLYDTGTVEFKEGTEALLKGITYVYREGNWIEKGK